MNHLEVTKPESENQLGLYAEILARATYPGYPSFRERLVVPIHALARTATQHLIIPDGSWSVTCEATRDESYASYTERFSEDGYEIDSQNRPLHPWFSRMINDPRIGVVTGRGAYWSWGPNRTADSVVVYNDHLLLIQRHDTGDWALPGGFIDNEESALTAARREVFEETGVKLINQTAKELYNGPVVDPRMTANAWPETTAYLFTIPFNGVPQPTHGSDDAKDAAWIPFEALPHFKLFGSHRYLTCLALTELGFK